MPITPMEFAKTLADLITSPLAQEVGKVVKEALRTKPEQKYQVVRQTVSGPVQTQVSLAQIMAELTDQLLISNDLHRYMLNELQENRKLGEKIRKDNKRQRLRDEDEE